MPICVFVARFYKETYNLKSFKGQKTWCWVREQRKSKNVVNFKQKFKITIWMKRYNGMLLQFNFFLFSLKTFQMHMIRAGSSLLFMYMGYLTDKLVDEADAHFIIISTFIPLYSA